MIEIIKSDAFKKSTWSGGTTTQLYIYPQNADYQKIQNKYSNHRTYGIYIYKTGGSKKNYLYT